MKINKYAKTLTALILSLSIWHSAFSQETDNWKLLNPTPTAEAGIDICFLNVDTGYILTNCAILGTTDSGITWNIVSDISSGNHMAFKDNFGYIVGNQGKIYKSTYMGIEWREVNTPFSEDLTGISIISKDTVFVTGNNKLYASFDEGNNWNTLNIANGNITVSVFTSSSVGHVGFSNGNIYKTIDGGQTWSLKSSINTSSCNINKMYFIDQTTGFVSRGYMSELLKTTDGGETWNVINSSIDEIYAFHFLNSQVGFISGSHGITYKTTNGGIDWQWIGFQNGLVYGTDIYGIHFIDTQIGFITGLGGRIMKTIDGGASWTAYSPTYNGIKQLQWTSDFTAYAAFGNSFLKTTDGGNKWENIGAPIATANTRQFDFVSDNVGYCIAGGDINSSASVRQVFKTTNGGITWTATGNVSDYFNDNLYAIDFINDDIGFVSGGYNDNSTFKTIDGGNSWTKINSYSFGQMQFINESVGYARNVGNYYNRIYKTIDGGTTWSVTFEIGDDITSFFFLDENNGYFVGDDALMYKTNDGGTTWKKITVPYAYYVNVKFYSLNVGFITDDYGNTYQTSDGGFSWAPVNKPYSVAGMEIYRNEIYAHGSSGIIMKKNITYQPAVLTVTEASEITSNSVTLSGNATSNNEIIKNIRFLYGKDYPSTQIVVRPDSVLPNESLEPTVHPENLEPKTTYRYMLSATVNDVSYSSNILTFTTLPDYEITIGYTYNVTMNEAYVNGYLAANSNNITDIEFQYGTDTNFNNTISAQPNIVLSGTNETVSAKLISLEAQTRYYVRIKAKYNGLDIFSDYINFTTPASYTINMYNPYVVGNNATVNFYITSNQDIIKNIVLEYGTTREYSNKVNISGEVPQGYSDYFSGQMTELDSAVVYFYRIKAEMGTQTIYSSENILKLQRDIVFVPIEVRQLSENSVLLQGLINSNGNYLYDIKFQYGTTELFDDSVIATPDYSSDFSTNIISATLDNINSDVRYYARISAKTFENQYFSDTFAFNLLGLSVKKLETDKVLIYPNPVRDYINIKTASPVYRVEIYNSSGSLLLVAKNMETINISHLSKGIYYVKISADNNINITTRKIIKN